ncbi:LCP family protein [Quadrisphaera sp. DSM 44207]|uniref:LCP family protein n=1 Tax=Quadrisphaera sp. DSM 44207 TaxID=1881057 RepID=UPI0008893209|nr:LCP family protein [Quadrisphaera sp. DSM 44207]SDQ19542.1 transcriptional attenuator, LytR family [Quadrisphaera sp. DSM 44207]
MAAEPATYRSRRDARSGGRVDVRSEDAGAGGPAGAPGGASRGHHASGRGDFFGRLMGMTVLGALVPGAGLVAAGRRRTGWALIALDVVVVAAAAALLASGRALDLGLRLATSPTAMTVLAAVAAGVGLLWCLVILVSHLALRRERLTWSQNLLAAVLVVALVGVVGVPSATAVRYSLTQRSLLTNIFDESGGREGLAAPTAGSDPWAGVPRINVLLLGGDSGEDREGTRPDTIIVASIDTATGDSVLLNLPRQLEEVPFPAGSPAASAWPQACEENGEGGCMLNATWLFGEQRPELFPGAPDPGLAATRAAVSAVLDLQIDYVAVVDMKGFEDLVNAMGGIVLDVPRDIPIGGGTNLATGRKYPITGYIEAGQDRRLNGYEALWFARSREGSSNDERMDRQRCVISAAVHQFDVVQLARAFPALAASAERNVETDISASELNAFVELGLKVKDASLRSLSFTSANIDTGDPDYDRIHQLVDEALAPPPPPAPSAAPSPGASPSASSAPVPADGATPAPVDPNQAVETSQVCGG